MSTEALSEMRPSVSTRTRSASRIASSTSWVTSRTAGRWRRYSSRSSWCMRMRVRASRAPNGSSSNSSCGSRTSARARATRCASPPDSVRGQAWACLSRPTSARRGEPACRARGLRQAEGDVAQHPLPRQQPGVLEHHGTAAAARGSPPRRRCRGRRAHAGRCSCPSRCARAAPRTRRGR